MVRFRFIILLFLTLFLVGCASDPSHEVLKYGGSTTDFQKGISEYHQVESTFVAIIKGRSVIMSQPFPLNEHINLSPNVKGISIGLHLKNSAEDKYEIWEEYIMLYKELPFPYTIRRKLEEGSLKERVVNINLPFEEDTYYSFRLKICNGKGDTLFTIGDVKYATGKKQK